MPQHGQNHGHAKNDEGVRWDRTSKIPQRKQQQTGELRKQDRGQAAGQPHVSIHSITLLFQKMRGRGTDGNQAPEMCWVSTIDFLPVCLIET